MLAKLPMYILNPNEELASDMMMLALFDENEKSKAIKTAGVLCYSILLHKIYKNVGDAVPLFLKQRLEHFNERIICRFIEFFVLYIIDACETITFTGCIYTLFTKK